MSEEKSAAGWVIIHRDQGKYMVAGKTSDVLLDVALKNARYLIKVSYQDALKRPDYIDDNLLYSEVQEALSHIDDDFDTLNDEIVVCQMLRKDDLVQVAFPK